MKRSSMGRDSVDDFTSRSVENVPVKFPRPTPDESAGRNKIDAGSIRELKESWWLGTTKILTRQDMFAKLKTKSQS
jgi:hypothetical protein